MTNSCFKKVFHMCRVRIYRLATDMRKWGVPKSRNSTEDGGKINFQSEDEGISQEDSHLTLLKVINLG